MLGTRHEKHILLREIGMEGQERIAGASVLVIGVGGLGCAAVRSLCGAGVGFIRVVDGDRVEESNLARQTLFGPVEVGTLKAEAAKRELGRINPEVQVEAWPVYVNRENVGELMEGMDLVLDCTDNHAVRYIVDDAAGLRTLPVIYAALHHFQGQLAVFHRGNGLRFRSLFPDEEQLAAVPTCASGGVYAVLPATLGVMQANEALKIILGIGRVADDRILIYDALNNTINSYEIPHEEYIPTRSDIA